MKRSIFLFLVICVVMLPMSIIKAQEPIRLVTLPIIITSNARVSTDALNQMKVKISRSLHVPLNGTLKKVEYIPSTKSSPVLQDIWSKIYQNNKKAKLKEAMKPLAEELNADFIVCTVLYSCNEMTSISMGFDHSTLLWSNAGVEMILFDNRTDELLSKKRSRVFNDEYSPRGTADALAIECLTDLIEELNPRKRMLMIYD